ncbi:T6SS immunity protein Tli3 family protein [Enterobacter mori]
MKGLCVGIITTAVLFAAACKASEPPTQVVYRFDDHRYLELKGWDCEGELWYTDTERGIHSQPFFQFYRIFTKKFEHPSQRYIAVPNWEVDGFMVSKDYGQTWKAVGFSPSGNEPNGDNRAPAEDAVSFTVVNDQGFLQTKHRLYMSSKPFDDPRILPGGPGIQYRLDTGEMDEITPDAPGWSWGMVYFTQEGLQGKTMRREANYQGLPDKVPEVKGYTGWDHMRCDMDVGK